MKSDKKEAEIEQPKFAETSGHAIILLSMGQWGRGKTIHEAASNHPAGLTKVSNARSVKVIVQVFSWRKGDKIPDGYDEMIDCIFVDGMGSTHYAAGMNVFQLNEKPVPLTRLFSEDAVK